MSHLQSLGEISFGWVDFKQVLYGLLNSNDKGVCNSHLKGGSKYVLATTVKVANLSHSFL